MKNGILFPFNPVHTQTVTDDASLADLNFPAYAAFEHALYTSGVELYTFARWLRDPESGNTAIIQTVAPQYERFRDEFREDTGVGIMLGISQNRLKNAVERPVFALDPDDLSKSAENAKRLNERLSLFTAALLPEMPETETTPNPKRT